LYFSKNKKIIVYGVIYQVVRHCLSIKSSICQD